MNENNDLPVDIKCIFENNRVDTDVTTIKCAICTEEAVIFLLDYY